MRLWLIRHAHAAEGATDGSRTLSPAGEKQMAALAEFLRRGAQSPPEEIWHSPLRRARQTAQMLCRGAGWPTPLRERDQLLPYDDVGLIAEELIQEQKQIAIVGHQPQLGRLASWLVTGDSEAESFFLTKGAVLVLNNRAAAGDATGGLQRWAVAWMVTPEILGAAGS
jgi:phosphohistidine phosphatase